MRKYGTSHFVSSGLTLGFTIGMLELLIGCGFSDVFPAPTTIMPSPTFVLSVLVMSLVTVWLLTQLTRGRLGLAAGLWMTLFLAVYVELKSRTLFSPWESWRMAILICLFCAGIIASILLQYLTRSYRGLESGKRVAFEIIIGYIVYGAIWLATMLLLIYSGEPRPFQATQLLVVLPAVISLVVLLRAKRTSHIWAYACLLFAALLISIPLFSSSHPTTAPNFTKQGEAKPSVILLVVDTLRADHLGLYGYHRDTSPNLDRFAENATVFERCIAPSAWTFPSHVSLLTGLYPRSHGAHLRSDAKKHSLFLEPELNTLAESFRDAGYFTAAAVANPWLVSKNGFDQGFLLYDDRVPHTPLLPPFLWNLARVTEPFFSSSKHFTRWIQSGDSHFKPYRTFPTLLQTIRQWFSTFEQNSFFLFINAMEPHDPFDAPPPFRNRWTSTRQTKKIPFHEVRRQVMAGQLELEEWLVAHLVDRYDEEISNIDDQLGLFLEELKQHDLFTNSWIIVTSDHGEHFGEHGLLWHRTSLYDPLIRVPLIVKRPGQINGTRIKHLVQLHDIGPTVLRELQIPVPNNASDGDLYNGRKEAFAELYYDDWIVKEHGTQYKKNLFAYEYNQKKIVRSSDGSEFLYDLSKDPEETINIDRHSPEESMRYREHMEHFLKSIPIKQSNTEAIELNAEERARLRSLGYLN